MKEIAVHGDQLNEKAENHVRLYFENVDGFNIKPKKPVTENIKLNYFSLLMAKMDVDIFGGAECRAQWDLIPHTHNIQKSLNLREGSYCWTGFNTNERFSINQQGGTFITSTPRASQSIRDMGVDHTGLGRWSWMRFEGRIVTTRVVIAYQPCVTRKHAITSTMAQQKRYWRLRGTHECPRVKFREDLIHHLKQWRDNGEKLVLLIWPAISNAKTS